MPDMPGHDAPQSDTLHTLTLRELEARVAAAGVLISHRQLMRHCEAGTFEAKKLPATNNVLEWFIAPGSVEKGIADIKILQEQRARRDAARRDTTQHDVIENSPPTEFGMSGHDASRPNTSEQKLQEGHQTDTTGHVPTRRDMTDQRPSHERGETHPDTSRRVETPDIFEHPYVKRLEAQVEKWEGKYHEQVRRTEEIQMKSTQQILELQRMTAIGQSETLADFMLKAKDWILGQGSETPDKSATSDAPAA